MFGMILVSPIRADTVELDSRYVLGRLPNWSVKLFRYKNGRRELGRPEPGGDRGNFDELGGYIFRSPTGAEYDIIHYSLEGDGRGDAFAKNGDNSGFGNTREKVEASVRAGAYIVAYRQLASYTKKAWRSDESSNGFNSHYRRVYITTKMRITSIFPTVEMQMAIERHQSFPTSDYDIIQLARAIADGAQEQLAASQSSARAGASQSVEKLAGAAIWKTFFVGTWTWKDPNNSHIWHSMSLSSDGSAMYYWRNPNQEPILQMWPFEWKATSADTISLGGRIYTLRDGKLYQSGNVKDGFVKAKKSK